MIYFALWDAEFEKIMIAELEEEGKVIGLKLEKHFRNYQSSLKKYKWIYKFFIRAHVFFKLRAIKEDDILLCNVAYLPDIMDLIKPLKCNKILICRDLISILSKKHFDVLMDNISCFSKIYSFDKNDCKTYNFKYLPQFLPFSFEKFKKFRQEQVNKKEHNKTLHCFFIGVYRVERAKMLNLISPILNNLNCKTDFYLFKNKEALNDSNNANCFEFKTFQYMENIEHVKKTDILLELGFIDQSGPSLRVIEALLFNKKIITTNKTLKEYEFYDPNQIFILDNNEQELYDFLRTPFDGISIDKLYFYSSDGMLAQIQSNFI